MTQHNEPWQGADQTQIRPQPTLGPHPVGDQNQAGTPSGGGQLNPLLILPVAALMTMKARLVDALSLAERNKTSGLIGLPMAALAFALLIAQSLWATVVGPLDALRSAFGQPGSGAGAWLQLFVVVFLGVLLLLALRVCCHMGVAAVHGLRVPFSRAAGILTTGMALPAHVALLGFLFFLVIPVSTSSLQLLFILVPLVVLPLALWTELVSYVGLNRVGRVRLSILPTYCLALAVWLLGSALLVWVASKLVGVL